jgi:hypothetical protein
MKAIGCAKKKSDRLDARTLADLLRCHLMHRLLQDAAFALDQAPSRARKTGLQDRPHPQDLAVMPLHLVEEFVIAAQGRVIRVSTIKRDVTRRDEGPRRRNA